MNRISYTDIEEIVGFPISEECKQIINILDTSFSPLTQQERDDVILNIINHIDLDLEKTGQHRLEKWEKGWYENFELLKNGAELSSLVPKYFGKYDIVRWKGDFVKANNIHLDYYQISILVDAILHEYVGDKYSNLFEFGCGPAYHLLRFEGFNNKINLTGLDWTVASQNIIKELNQLNLSKLSGHNFNFFEPDYQVEIPESSAVFTVNALEQVGENYKDFINFLLYKKPELCINFEPMSELLDSNNLLDNLCIKYSEKRNYLKGYLPYLEQLEKEGKIEIILKKRLYAGSLYLEGYPVVIWKPKK
jgi:hypothetical protein